MRSYNCGIGDIWTVELWRAAATPRSFECQHFCEALRTLRTLSLWGTPQLLLGHFNAEALLRRIAIIHNISLILSCGVQALRYPMA